MYLSDYHYYIVPITTAFPSIKEPVSDLLNPCLQESNIPYIEPTEMRESGSNRVKTLNHPLVG